MCGIYCLEAINMHSIETVYVALHRMKHRGPDGLGHRKAGHMVLGLARLAIVDRGVEAAEQPYLSSSGRVTVFNGEVYNYRALDPTTPSEVALISSILDGHEDLRRYLEGDYAVASMEPSTDTLTLYRDRFGICPLYYQLKPWVAVSSEARRLYKPKEVPAHGRVRINVKTRQAKVDVFPLYGATNDAPTVGVVSALIIEAVQSRYLHSEVPVALALSGGLDSSLIATALSNLGSPLEEYICTAFSPTSDDMHYARILAQHLRVPLHTVTIDEHQIDAFKGGADVLEHLDNPREKITPLCYRTALRSWFVAKFARSRVILCGDGPDELLGGYPSHQALANKFPAQRWRINAKRYDTLRSMQHFNNDRTNKMGMAHSKEFRSPFLASTLSQVLLAQRWQERKQLLRDVGRYMGMPEEVYNRPSKYSPDEEAVTSIP